MSIPEYDDIIEPNDQTEARRTHLAKLRELVGNVYPNKFDRSQITGAEDTISNVVNFAAIREIVKQLKDNTPENEKPDQELKAKLNEQLKQFGNVRISGRLAVPPRVMGKAAFVHLSDGKNRLQIYVRKQDAQAISNDTGKAIDEEGKAWEVFGLLDHGDFVGVSGYLFLTNTGELSVHVETLQFLAKAMLPMPDKMHGIADPELQRRFRYADLIASSLQIEHEGLTTREVFERRAKLISGMRNYLDAHGFIEVETPMLTPKATGAAAKPFATHHNALDIPLFARIAPELYLKRLIVGGFEKVYELNRNFRNEGLSNKHNPEFTMLEFYCAYMDVNGMMDFSEAMIKESVQKATGGNLQVKYGENEIDFEKPFERVSMTKSITKYLYNLLKNTEKHSDSSDISLSDLRRIAAFVELTISGIQRPAFGAISVEKANEMINEPLPDELVNKNNEKFWELSNIFSNSFPDETEIDIEGERLGLKIRSDCKGNLKRILAENNETEVRQKLKLTQYIFDDFVEPKLTNPTFIIDYPKSISPLSKASPENPQIAERFELFIAGMECANGFSELNDPQEQYERFADQMRERTLGDEEAMVLDEDYIRALAYGMPPAAGIGIGIDRLVMLLTNKHSIRDVILFPHLRPIVREEAEKEPDNAAANESGEVSANDLRGI